jgi:hypothetical protein
MIDFIDFIAGLAPEGETALLSYQKPVRKGGEAQMHADGTPKYTWPSFLPSERGKGEAPYLNTGSFILDRMTKGVSASADNCEFVLCMMLDDVGTDKVPKTPPLAPTWIMETSPGSFQWGYAFKDQPPKAAFIAAIKAIAAAGYTDPGAVNAVRKFRVPGSVNLKPGRDNFASQLVEFHPEREFTLDGICEALGVVPDEADTAAHTPLRLTDTGSDPVLKWLSEHGMVLSRANAAGWVGIVCPNKDAHSDGSIDAGYRPLDRSFCCHHGHCEDLSSAAFLEWVGAQGGPLARQGLRDDLLADQMRQMQEKLTPSAFFTDDTAAVIAEVERKELGRLERADWYKRFAYVQSEDSYFDLAERREVTRSAFNALYRHIHCISVNGGRRIEASVCFDENRQALGAASVAGVTYAAGENVLVAYGGDPLANRWRDARPAVSGGGDPTKWLDHCRTMVPDADLLEHLWDVMAFKLQNPAIKVNHAVLHGGDEGCGKDSMWAPFIWSVCGPHMLNRGLVDNESLSSQFDYHLESEILLINELREPDAGARRVLANRLKPIIAAPPETLPINRKHHHPYSMANRLFVLAFSNDPVPLSLPSQDRRWCCVWSYAPRMDPDAGWALWQWFKSGGFEACAAWLYARDVRAFNPGAAPPWTDFKANLVEHGMSIAEGYLLTLIQTRAGEFAAGVISSPLHSLCDRLSAGAPHGVKIPQPALLHALKEAGWRDLGRIASIEHPTKKQIFAAPAVAAKHSKSDLRRMVEVAAERKVQI